MSIRVLEYSEFSEQSQRKKNQVLEPFEVFFIPNTSESVKVEADYIINIPDFQQYNFILFFSNVTLRLIFN